MNRLLFGPLAGALFAAGVAGLALTIPGYDHIRQTVSTIGATGSPARIPFAILLCAVGACILVFAVALRDLSRGARRSALPAYLTACMALPGPWWNRPTVSRRGRCSPPGLAGARWQVYS